MKLERSNVEFAIWQKKVDKSLFEQNGTTIPDRLILGIKNVGFRLHHWNGV